MSHSNESEWNRLWDLFINEKDSQKKEILMEALTSSKETSLLTRYIGHLILFIWNINISYIFLDFCNMQKMRPMFVPKIIYKSYYR